MSVHEPGDTMVEALRRANPVPVGQGESRRALPSAHALFADIIAEPQRRRAARVRTRTIVIVISIVLLLLALVAFVALREDSPTEPASVVCYASADLHARRVVVGLSGDEAQACEAIWSKGGFAAIGIKGRPSGFDVCVLPGGVAAVFPGESGSVCSRLGLSQSSGDDKNIAGFAHETDGRTIEECMGYDEAERMVKGELTKWRLEGWTIKRGASRPHNADYPCSSIFVDTPAREVVILSYPRITPPEP